MTIKIIGDPKLWGFIPDMLNEADPRSAREQFDEKYIGGWEPFKGFKFSPKDGCALSYSGDPPIRPIAAIAFRNELLFLYESSWVLIMQGDGSWEVNRMD